MEQNHLTLAFPGLPYGHKKRFVLQLLSSMLGGGMSSRLFQEVRERRGLCYSVYTYGAGHAETGVFAIYTALGKETEAQALETICRTIRDFAERGPAAEELDRARELSKANVLMGLESTQSRMSALGRGTLLRTALSPPTRSSRPITPSRRRTCGRWPGSCLISAGSPSLPWAGWGTRITTGD
ncbi:MAG: M16 family metallopeptidase [Intestinimonas sp.]